MSAVVAAGAPPAHSLSNNNSIKTPNDPSKSTHKSDAGHNSDRKAQQLKLPQTYSAPMNMTPVTVTAVVQQTPHTPSLVHATSPYPETAGTYEVIPHRIFVGGFPPDTLENDLRELFEKHGQVREVKVIRDTESGVSKGYGFVTFETDEEARNIRTSNERLEIDGRRLNLGPAMRRIHHNQRYNDLIAAGSPSPVFAAPNAPGGAVFQFGAQPAQQFMPLNMSVQQAVDAGYFISQPYVHHTGVQYVFAVPPSGVQYAYNQPTPTGGYAQQQQQLASLAYTPAATPQQAAAYMPSSTPAYPQQQQYMFGHMDMTQQMQQQQAAAQQQVPQGKQVVVAQGNVSPSSNHVNNAATRTTISRTPTRFGGGARSARRSIHTSLTTSNASTGGNEAVQNSQQSATNVYWPQSSQNDNNRWQQMSQAAAAGCIDQSSYAQSATGNYYPQSSSYSSTNGYGQQPQQQYDNGAQYGQQQQPPAAVPLGLYSTGGDMYGGGGGQQQQSEALNLENMALS